MSPGRLSVAPPLTVMLPLLNDVRLPSVRFSPGPATFRFTLDRLARLLSLTVPPLEAWRVELVQPLASVKLVRADTLSTLPVPSLSRTTVPVLIVLSAERVTVPPARASNLIGPGRCWSVSVTVARFASVRVLPVPVASSVVVPPLPV